MTQKPMTTKVATRKLRKEILASRCVFCDQPFLPCELRDNAICSSTNGEAFAHVACVEVRAALIPPLT